MRLDELQRRLESIYELQLDQRIDDFFTTDQGFLSLAGDDKSSSREQVLLQQEGEDVWLSLYLDAGVYNNLLRSSESSMCSKQAGDFCLAVEGVSHFMYLCWNANFDKEVTQLELELQAEVDKYLLLLECAGEEVRRKLHQWLFEECSYHDGLSEEQQDRYEKANHYAGKYCLGLEQRYLRAGKNREMSNELRRFYRKTQTQKLHMIETVN